jgi:hypothetical protein
MSKRKGFTLAESNKNGQDGQKGRSSHSRLASAYPQSPAYSGEYDDVTVHAMLTKELLEGVVTNGHMFASYDRDFNGDGTISAPGYADVDVAGANLSNPFMANLGSPGQGSFDDDSKPAPSEHLEDASAIVKDNFGSGGNITERTPANSSSKMALGNPSNLVKGKSPASET